MADRKRVVVTSSEGRCEQLGRMLDDALARAERAEAERDEARGRVAECLTLVAVGNETNMSAVGRSMRARRAARAWKAAAKRWRTSAKDGEAIGDQNIEAHTAHEANLRGKWFAERDRAAGLEAALRTLALPAWESDASFAGAGVTCRRCRRFTLGDDGRHLPDCPIAVAAAAIGDRDIKPENVQVTVGGVAYLPRVETREPCQWHTEDVECDDCRGVAVEPPHWTERPREVRWPCFYYQGSHECRRHGGKVGPDGLCELGRNER